MLGEQIDFNSCCKENEIIEFLYKIFQDDFINCRCYLADKIYIDPKSDKLKDGKEEIFWHVTTKDNPRSKKREFDRERASRLKWIKNIIHNYHHDDIKLFYHYEKNKKIRLYLWAEKVDFIVIIQKLGRKSSYLVTSFYINKNYNRKIYSKRYDAYLNKKDEKLNGCEWF